MSLDASTSTAEPTTTIAMTIPATEAATERPSSVRTSAAQNEAGSPHGLDERRVAELASEIGHVPVDAVLADTVHAPPDACEGQASRHHLPLVSEQELEQIGLARAEDELPPTAARSARRDLER